MDKNYLEEEQAEQLLQTPEPAGISEESPEDKPKGIKRAEVVEQVNVTNIVGTSGESLLHCIAHTLEKTAPNTLFRYVP